MAIKYDQTPWEYKKGTSFLHRIPGGVKLLFLLAVSISAFLVSLKVLIILFGFILTAALIADIKPHQLFKGGLPLIIFVFMVFAIGCIDLKIEEGIFYPAFRSDGITEALVFSFRIALSYSTASLFFNISPMSETRRTLTKAESFLHLKKTRIGISLALMISFISKFFTIWEDQKLAWESRMGKKGLSVIIKILPLVIGRLIRKAEESAIALESRGML